MLGVSRDRRVRKKRAAMLRGSDRERKGRRDVYEVVTVVWLAMDREVEVVAMMLRARGRRHRRMHLELRQHSRVVGPSARLR